MNTQLGPPDELIFEEKPSAIWIFCVIGALFLGGLSAASIPPAKLLHWASAAIGAFGAAFWAFLAVRSFRVRNDHTRYFGDHVERFRNGKLLHRLAYADVEYAAYGIRVSGRDQFLSFSGCGGQPLFIVMADGDDSPVRPGEVSPEKLHALRDLLYEIIAERMVARASDPEGAAWVNGLRLSRAGLLVGTTVIPWSEVQVSANESTGDVVVYHNGRVLAKASMIEDNVDAGLLALQRLQAAYRSGAAPGCTVAA